MPTVKTPAVVFHPGFGQDRFGQLRVKAAFGPAHAALRGPDPKHSGKTIADWLRTVALEAARPIPDTTELLLAEVAATRYLVLNLFHASAKSAQDREPFLPETVLKIRESADARKHQTARKLIQDFVASDGKTRGER